MSWSKVLWAIVRRSTRKFSLESNQSRRKHRQGIITTTQKKKSRSRFLQDTIPTKNEKTPIWCLLTTFSSCEKRSYRAWSNKWRSRKQCKPNSTRRENSSLKVRSKARTIQMTYSQLLTNSSKKFRKKGTIVWRYGLMSKYLSSARKVCSPTNM